MKLWNKAEMRELSFPEFPESVQVEYGSTSYR